MYIVLKNQKDILSKAIKKAGTYRKLSKILKIPRSSVLRYYQGGTIPKERFEKLVLFLGIEPKELKFSKLEKNWRQKLGGKNCVKIKKQKGTYEKQLKKAQERGISKIKKWHKSMKKDNPEKYYSMQYSKFKKIGGYKHTTKKGEKVRNKFEKEVADILYELKLEYEYETLIKIGKTYFFPDFLINNKIIVECTAWKGEVKAYKLKEKLNLLKRKYRVFVVIPKNLYSYYKILDKHLIKGLDEFVPVAQTFPSL